MRWLWLLAGCAWAATAHAESVGPRGMAPLRLDCTGDEALCREASTCGDCHPDQYAQWQTSRHGTSWSNQTFQHGFARDPKRFCFHCHAPLETEWPRFAAQRSDAPSEGINCQVCHVAELAPGARASHEDSHPVRALSELRDPAFCASCHEFDLIEERLGKMVPTDLPLQETYTEWVHYRDAGGRETCQSCHMPGGDHRFRGAHDLAFFRSALTLDVHREAAGWRVALTNTGVGHNVPTGDIFRQLLVERVDPQGQVEPMAVFQRVFDVRYDPAADRFRKVLVANNSLRPGQRVEWTLATEARGRVRVVYHWAQRALEAAPPQVVFEVALGE